MGVGIVVYFRLLKFLGCMFLLFTVISLPSLIMYQAGNSDDVGGTFDSKSTFSKYSLGNLGASTKSCSDGLVSATGPEDEMIIIC